MFYVHRAKESQFTANGSSQLLALRLEIRTSSPGSRSSLSCHSNERMGCNEHTPASYLRLMLLPPGARIERPA